MLKKKPKQEEQEKENMKRVSFHIEPEDHEELKRIFGAEGLGFAVGLRYILRRFIKRYNKNPDINS